MLQLIAAQSFNCRLFAHRYPVDFQNLLHPSIQFQREHGGEGTATANIPQIPIIVKICDE